MPSIFNARAFLERKLEQTFNKMKMTKIRTQWRMTLSFAERPQGGGGAQEELMTHWLNHIRRFSVWLIKPNHDVLELTKDKPFWASHLQHIQTCDTRVESTHAFISFVAYKMSFSVFCFVVKPFGDGSTVPAKDCIRDKSVWVFNQQNLGIKCWSIPLMTLKKYQ